MSIGLVINYTYKSTCEICEVISNFASKTFTNMIHTFEVVGTAKAASQLAAQGYHKEAKALMLHLKELKKNA
jgi:glucan biosynthesis protein